MWENYNKIVGNLLLQRWKKLKMIWIFVNVCDQKIKHYYWVWNSGLFGESGIIYLQKKAKFWCNIAAQGKFFQETPIYALKAIIESKYLSLSSSNYEAGVLQIIFSS